MVSSGGFPRIRTNGSVFSASLKSRDWVAWVLICKFRDVELHDYGLQALAVPQKYRPAAMLVRFYILCPDLLFLGSPHFDKLSWM